MKFNPTSDFSAAQCSRKMVYASQFELLRRYLLKKEEKQNIDATFPVKDTPIDFFYRATIARSSERVKIILMKNICTLYSKSHLWKTRIDPNTNSENMTERNDRIR